MTALGMIRPIGYFRRTSRYPPARDPAGGTCAKSHGGVLLLRHVRGACGADAACILSLQLPDGYRYRVDAYLTVFNPSSSVFCAIPTSATLNSGLPQYFRGSKADSRFSKQPDPFG
ncbi:uncharacterized protein TrAtP1_007556 [Trichoderma atroviride]|uniref:uncharacterized protein n=1 Tax=Hypocrea atroviridis TaxID=63577 RepID=UPI00332C2D4E|nr:hypothetical protein TrAtP1_007556 [Trichoderma atroviride]